MKLRHKFAKWLLNPFQLIWALIVTIFYGFSGHFSIPLMVIYFLWVHIGSSFISALLLGEGNK